MRDEGRRARIVAAVTEPDTAGGAGELLQRLCRFAVDEMTLSGCALALMPGTDSAKLVEELRAAPAAPARGVSHQATGRSAGHLAETISNALARLRAAAFGSGRPMHDIAQDVVERRVRFDE